jgi:hypothetical protein
LGGPEICDRFTTEGRAIYEARTIEMAEMQDWLCAICGFWMANPQFEHAAGRGFDGGHRDDRTVDAKGNRINAAVCEPCNLHKGSQRYHWLNNSQYVPVVKMTEVA